ncbi:phage major capsid protein [Pleomorphomonas carboxyditropha]|uniref:Phage major capsid protein n=1 Tax=Pleomorphomonas carboxyditropha TaxID=2023338 RepID=A0A2G9WQA8_9HYPH|nr:phage major capsid protein [Pleomorphomonas carboxyditropha]PIO96854.1 phage major capsid protein [Pleomorphomonas carboxyditropha]
MSFHTKSAEFRRKNEAIDRADDQASVAEIMQALQQRDEQIKAFATKADSEIKSHGRILEETKSALDKILSEAGGMAARLVEVEQKLAKRAGGGVLQVKSIGEQFTATTDFLDLQKKGKGFARLNLKAVTSITSATTGTGGVGDAIRPDRLADIVRGPDRVMTIRNMLAPGRTASNAIEYVKESGFQNMAAPVAETAAKPQSDLAFDLVTTNVRTIAHWFLASKQVLEDVPALQSYIDTRARYGLAYKEEEQLLSGDGTGQNLHGLIPQATAFDDDLRSVGDTRIDVLRRAILQVRIAEYRASGIVLNPLDWAEIELLKDDSGKYIWSNPTINNGQNLWGLPVVDTNAMPAGKFMVGAFNIAAQVFDREDAAVEVSTEDSDNFRKNMITIRAEERLALAVMRPESFVHGPFVAPTP